MSPNFIRNILPRRLRYRDREETVTSQAAGQASVKATNDALRDPPPSYASGNYALDDDKELHSNSSSIRPTDPEVPTQPASKLSSCDSIRVCPHATSSFERIQRIVKLPNFKNSYEGLDTLTPGSDHRDHFTSGFRLCKPDSGSNLCIKGWGEYLYDKYGTVYPWKARNPSEKAEGLVLQFFWMIDFSNVPREQRQSRDDINHLLSQARVEICTHLTLSSPLVVAAVNRTLHPGDDEVDPIDLWEAGCTNGITTVACEECATVAEIHGVGTHSKVDTKRYLGRGETPSDPRWLAQCGVREGSTIVTDKVD